MHSSTRILSVLGAAFLTGAALPTSPLADAAERRDMAAVRQLLTARADVNAAQGDGMTALHWAAHNGDVAMASALLDAKASTRAVTRIGALTPLHLASEIGNAGVVTALLKAGADPKAVTSIGMTALHYAALAGSAATITALADKGAPVNAKEPAWGQTPLMLAAAKGRLEAVKALLARGADASIAARVVDLLDLAARDRASKSTRNAVLAAARARDKADTVAGWHPSAADVQAAARAGIVTERKDPSQQTQAEKDSVAAAVAAATAANLTNGNQGDEDPAGYTEMIGFQGGLTALLLAVREGNADIVKALLDGGANVNQVTPADHTSPLLEATINGHYDIALALLSRGADPNLASDAGATPLYGVINKEWAPSSRTPQPTYNLQQKTGYLELMEALLKAKANPNVRLNRSLWYTTYNRDNLRVDFRGATPFFRAAYADDVPAMKLLVAYGADPKVPTIKPPARARGRGAAPAATSPYGGADVPVAPSRTDPSGLPPVPDNGPGVPAIVAAAGIGYGQGYAANDHHHAADGWLPTIKYLVEVLGADVNARDMNGFTPLHFAAARGDNELILYLVSKGADPKAVARSGQTTADMANGPVQRISPYLETVALLEKLGSKNNHKCVGC